MRLTINLSFINYEKESSSSKFFNQNRKAAFQPAKFANIPAILATSFAEKKQQLAVFRKMEAAGQMLHQVANPFAEHHQQLMERQEHATATEIHTAWTANVNTNVGTSREWSAMTALSARRT